MKKILAVFILFSIMFSFINNTFANDVKEMSVQEKCYNNLLENIKKLDSLWNKGYDGIFNKDYNFINKNLSKKYKNMSSFGIDLDTPNFEMRVYSFGRQTGYVHPPYSPYPVSTKTEKWITPSKEFIYAEEYIKTPDGESKFLSCSFMNIESSDLMNVKSENYAYDGDIISIIQKEKDGYKAWYNENISYDFNNTAFVTWKRLFIFPKETQNDYFDKYTVLDAFPSKTIDDFSKIYGDFYEGDGEKLRIYQTDIRGHIVRAVAPDSLIPVEPEGKDNLFPLNSYYQEIENNFPEFGQHLALRGVIHYKTLKEIFSTKDNKKYAHIWNTILDPVGITKYSLEKKQGKIKEEVEFYEKYLKNIGNEEEEVKKMLEADKIEKKDEIKKEDKIIQDTEVKDYKKNEDGNKIKELKTISNNSYIYILLSILFLFILGFFILKINKKGNK